MKKRFVAPVLRGEATLGELTLAPVCSNCSFDGA
jgi:hypothetical protein